MTNNNINPSDLTIKRKVSPIGDVKGNFLKSLLIIVTISFILGTFVRCNPTNEPDEPTYTYYRVYEFIAGQVPPSFIAFNTRTTTRVTFERVVDTDELVSVTFTNLCGNVLDFKTYGRFIIICVVSSVNYWGDYCYGARVGEQYFRILSRPAQITITPTNFIPCCEYKGCYIHIGGGTQGLWFLHNN